MYQGVRTEMALIRHETVDILLKIIGDAVLDRASVGEEVRGCVDALRNRDYAKAIEIGKVISGNAAIDALLCTLSGDYDAARNAVSALASAGLAAADATDCLMWIKHCEQTQFNSGAAGFVDKYERLPGAGPFIILMEQRTGSTLLVSLLNSHPNIVCYPEMLMDADAPFQEEIVRLVARGACLERLLPYAQSPKYHPVSVFAKGDLTAAGFKTKLSDIRSEDGFREALRDHGYKVVVTTRKNHVRQAVSAFNATRIFQERQLYNLRAGIDQIGGKLRLPIDRFLQALDELESSARKTWAYAESLGLPLHVIDYADLLGDAEAATRALLMFLGAPMHALRSGFGKATSSRLEDVVENYDEVRAALVGTRWAAQLDMA